VTTTKKQQRQALKLAREIADTFIGYDGDEQIWLEHDMGAATPDWRLARTKYAIGDVTFVLEALLAQCGPRRRR
jgi:hypothetical protein